jgi:hypothetical protein
MPTLCSELDDLRETIRHLIDLPHRPSGTEKMGPTALRYIARIDHPRLTNR